MNIDTDNGFDSHILRIHFGCAYRYVWRSRHGDIVREALYSPLFCAYHGRTQTDLVIYVGITGLDEGKHFACELADWELRFKLVEDMNHEEAEPAPVVRPPDRVAGKFTSGSGV